MDFLGEGFGGRVFVKGDGFFQAVDKKEAGVAVFHVVFQVLADLGVEFSVDVLRQFVENFRAQKERLGQEAGSDYCGLEITKVLSVTLTGPPEQGRIKALRDYFSSRFVKERELYE